MGDAPQWMSRDLSVLSDAQEIRARLHHRLSKDSASLPLLSEDWIATSRPSAVLVPLLTDIDAPSVVLTRRADHLRNHKGEISFPGGRMEQDELPHQTAIREAFEEIALPHDTVTILGHLDPIATFASNSHITPVVAHVQGEPVLVPEPGEVARVFSVPLLELARADTYRNEWWTTPRGEINIHFFELDDETIWGATGRLLHHLIDVVTQ
jgi:8-oxo-dGTP pyrophosphatase MutT (NUDIX family)